SLCILRSRPWLPLWPLVASNTISPVTLLEAGSKCNSPLFRLNAPFTVCSTSPRVKLAAVCAGSQRRTSSCAVAGGAGLAHHRQAAMAAGLAISLVNYPPHSDAGRRFASQQKAEPQALKRKAFLEPLRHE